MKNLIIKISAIFTLSFLFLSCEDFMDREPSDYSSVGFYKSEAAVKTGVTGVYNALYINLAYNLPFSIMLDHWTAFAMERAENNTIGAGGSLNPDNSSVRSWWQTLYFIIARANSIIYGAEPYLETLEGSSMQFLAEARVLRAFAYYNLISTFGDVPFYSQPVTIDQYRDERSAKEDILDFILSEMDEVAAMLPWTATERGRVDRAVAYGLKARAALLGGSLNYRGDGAEYFRIASQAAQAVFGQRSLAQNFDDLFNITGQAKADVRNEMLFELMYSDQGSKLFHMIGFGQISRNYG
ncbi:MAG: RagB/SusD family nutrient uptake outer membrane protein, partial [Bacteroidales bacterium]|nr:RagB/SusD family nutrient uptake outer membrane protein [Bacteroidales bacterium]